MAPRTQRIALIGLALIAILFYFASRNHSPATDPETLYPHGVLRVGVDPSMAPFAFIEDDQLRGLEIDLAHAIGQEIGIPVHLVSMGFDGLYDSLKADQVDIIIATLTINPLQLGDVRYTRPYFDAGLVLVSPASQPINTMAELSGHALAYEYGSSADREARLWQRRVRPFETRPYEHANYALDAVRLGQADAALVDAISARLYFRTHPAWAANYHPISENPYVIAARVDRYPLWEQVHEALQSLEDNGTLEMIVNQWL